MADKSRIVKNTLFMYIRMFITVGISLYASRVIIDVLGVDNYGIYTIVGGVVLLISFLNVSFTNGFQRFLNFAVGKDDEQEENEVFSNSIIVSVLLAIIIILLLETIGLWFLNNKLSFPEGTIKVVNIVYQISIITFIINLFRAPYNALILAHERFSFYAYITIAESALKLIIIYLLLIISINKLILYSLLVLSVSIITNLIFIIYCHYKIRQVRFHFHINRNLVLRLSSFSGWNMMGSIADIGYQQGTNMILNVFCGVAYNATMGLAAQVKNVIYSFVTNLTIVSNPQIIQSFATQNIKNFESLILQVSKFAFFLLLLIAVPVILNMDYILNLWLETIPPDASKFCILMLIYCMVDCFNGPLWTGAQAEGNIMVYQIISSSILLLNIPLSYVALKLNYAPSYIILIQICVCVICLIYRLMYLVKLKLISIYSYLRRTLLPSIAVSTIVITVTLLLSINSSPLLNLISSTIISSISCLMAVYYLGLSINEKAKIKYYIFKKFKHE